MLFSILHSETDVEEILAVLLRLESNINGRYKFEINTWNELDIYILQQHLLKEAQSVGEHLKRIAT